MATSVPSVADFPDTSSTDTSQSDALTTSSSAPGSATECSTFDSEVVLNRAWDTDTGVEFLIDTSVTFGSAAPLRSARRITIRSGPQVNDSWNLTMVDPLGERVANYADRLPIINPVDRDFVVTVDYTVGADGIVALESLDAGTAINEAYAQFVFDLFGVTDGELGEDSRFDSKWSDLVAAGGLEILDPSSAAARTLSMLAVIHAHHGDSFTLDEAAAYSGEWREVGMHEPIAFSEILVEASVALNGCLAIEAIASQAASGVTGTRTMYLDPETGMFLSSVSRVDMPSTEGDVGFASSISTVDSTSPG